MEIVKYASKTCVKCKVLDRLLKTMNLPNVETKYVECEDPEKLAKAGVTIVPTLLIRNNGKQQKLQNVMTKQMIESAMSEVLK